MATGMNPEILVGQRDIFGGEVQPPAFSQAAPSPRDFGEQSPRVFRGDSPQDFAGHAPQVFGDAQTGRAWPPEGCTIVPEERIREAITGMTIVSAKRDGTPPYGDEVVLELQGVECPPITLVITDDGYWTAVVAS